MLKKVLTAAFWVLIAVPAGGALAQSGTITGTVTDSTSGDPIPGVNVLVEGTEQGAATGADGTYEITSVEPGTYTVTASFVGYEEETEQGVEVQEGQTTPLDFVIQQAAADLEEIVVTGYGTQQREVNVTGSVATKGAEFIENRPLTNSSQALQGVKGAYVNQASGQPGASDAEIRLRGVGTFGNNDPLVLVDGVEYDLRDVNPLDIESISVLKDAAAAAIYGNRAANGVILIQTKSGAEGQGIQADYSGYYGMQESTFLPNMVTDAITYMEARNDASRNEGQAPVYSQEQMEEYRNGTDPDLYPNSDWYDIMFDPAPIQQHNLRVYGGGEETAYSLSLGYLDQGGVMRGTDAQKYSLSSNVNYDITSNLAIGGKVTGTFWNRNEPTDGARRVMNLVGRALPIQPNKLSDGRWGDTWLTTPGHNVFRNPLILSREGLAQTESQNVLGQVDVSYAFPYNIDYNLKVAVNKYDVLQSRFVPRVQYWNPKTNTARATDYIQPPQSALRRDRNRLNTTFYQTLSWDGNIAGHSNVDALLGFSRETFSDKGFRAEREGFFGNNLYDLDAGSTNDVARGSTQRSALRSFFGRVNYTFLERYILEVNARYDGSSRFAEGHRWGFFPSFSGAWRIDQEPFMQNVDFINNLKLRGSWGTLGNQGIPLFSYASTVELGAGHSFNNNLVSGAAITQLADRGITWETTTISNVGVDVRLLDQRLELSAEYYDKDTRDILTTIQIPAQVGGLEGPVTNLYSMSNKGFEVGGTFRQSVNDDFSYRIDGNAAYVKNNVEFLNGSTQYVTNTLWGNMQIISEGHSVRSYYLLDAQGIFQSEQEVENHADQGPDTQPGDLKYRDVDGNGVINNEDRVITGNSVPKWTYSFTLGTSFKGFDLSAFFQGVQDIETYPTHNNAYPVYNGAGIAKEQLDYWSEENKDAAYPRIGLPRRGDRDNYQLSTFWLRDASYLRLKNLNIGYDVPPSLTSRLNLRNLRVYVNAENILTLTDFTLADPEKQISTPNVFGYPNVKTYSLGVEIGI